LGTSGAWTQSSGELVLTAASGGLSSGTECVVMFELTNPDSAQSSPAVSVSAEIQDGSGNSVGSIASAEMTKPGWDLLGWGSGIGSVSGSGSGGGGIKACPANSNSAAGSAECVCDYGYTGSAGECSACSPGKFKATSGSTACAECETGKNNPNTGSSSADACVDCPAGSYSGDGAASCTDCPSDSSSPAGSVGIQACLCNPGYTGPNGGACVACGAGTYSATAGETTGVRITYVGGWSDGGGEGRTMLQYPRVSMSVSGLTSRLLQLIQQMETQSADEGYWAIQDNNEFWYTIGPTKSHERHGSGSTSGITPIVLPEHFWNGAVVENVGVGWTNAVYHITRARATVCVNCPAGSYSGDGAASCTDCPSDSSSPAGSVGIQACLCNPGYTGPNGGACVACGPGKYSTGDIVNKARGCGDGSSPCSVSASSRSIHHNYQHASLAVDGLIGVDQASNTNNFFITECNKANEWFMLDLESEYEIGSVRIFSIGDNAANTLSGAEIRVGNINSFDGNPTCASNLPGDIVITVTCAATGRYVFVVQPRPDTCLQFSEIEVPIRLGCIGALCSAGKYGQTGATSASAATCSLCPSGKFSAGATGAAACVLTSPSPDTCYGAAVMIDLLNARYPFCCACECL
jgi:hypothetical protein